MTEEEAIKHLELIIDNEAYSDYFQDVCRKAVEALEKQVAKKHIKERALCGFDYYCSNCLSLVGAKNTATGLFSFKKERCDCGQAIDWSEV